MTTLGTIYEETTYKDGVKITNRLFEDRTRILKIETKKVSANWTSLRYRLATLEDHARATAAMLEALTQTLQH